MSISFVRSLCLSAVSVAAGCGGSNSGADTIAWEPDGTGTNAGTNDSGPNSSPTEDSNDPTGATADPSTSSASSGPETGDGSSGGPVGGPAGSCGMGGGKNEILQIEMGSPERWYLIGAPDTDEPLPLVVAFHGDEGDPFESTRYIWGSYWEQNNLPFIVVMTKCPGCTSWYQGDTNANADYLWEVLADVATNHNVDVSRVYGWGLSGGSEFLAIHGWEFQDVFAGIQWWCGGNAYTPYTPPSRPDCKVPGRIVISADDFLYDGAQQLLARLEEEGHEHEYIEAQCSGHCCDTPDANEGAWAWFQTLTKCDGIVPGTCGELEDLPPAPSLAGPTLTTSTSGNAIPPAVSVARHPPTPTHDFGAARDRLDEVLVRLERGAAGATVREREALFAEAMGAYDRMLAAAHHEGPQAKAELQARYPRLRAIMAQLRN